MMTNNNRIVLVDALRGFALLGIMLLHAIEHFDLFWEADRNPEIFRTFDLHVSNTIRFLFSGKAYSVFSLMFGFSFFIQMDRAHARGIDFRWRFLWRLMLLCLIGYLLSLIYSSQILVIYAVMGLLLIPLYNVNNNILIVLAVLLLLQVPTIVHIISSYTNPEFVLQRNFGRGLWGEAFHTFANGSFLEVARFNRWKSHIAVWSWMYYNGRYLQLLGLFIIGLVLGKNRFFETFEKRRREVVISFMISVLLFAILQIVFLKFQKSGMPQPRFGLFYTLIKSYVDLALTSSYISLLIIIFQHVKRFNKSCLLANYGRMSLTNYIVQPLIGVPLFYGYGFALYHYLGATLSVLYGIVFFLLQLWFSKVWLKNFYYGPFEWLWRALTFFDLKLKFDKGSAQGKNLKTEFVEVQIADNNSKNK